MVVITRNEAIAILHKTGICSRCSSYCHGFPSKNMEMLTQRLRKFGFFSFSVNWVLTLNPASCGRVPTDRMPTMWPGACSAQGDAHWFPMLLQHWDSSTWWQGSKCSFQFWTAEETKATFPVPPPQTSERTQVNSMQLPQYNSMTVEKICWKTLSHSWVQPMFSVVFFCLLTNRQPEDTSSSVRGQWGTG